MDTNAIRVLLVEDNQADATLIRGILGEAGHDLFHVTQSERLAPALHQIREATYDAILLDLSLPDSQGIATFWEVRTAAPHLPIVILSGLNDDAMAISAVQEGAQDYLYKGQIDSDALARAIRYAIERHKVQLAQAGNGVQEKAGRVLGFLGAKGGVGTSTVALNIACTLAKRSTVIAAELKPAPGTFALQLHQTPVETIAGLLALAPEDIDQREIQAHLTSAPSGLKVLHGPRTYSDDIAINAEQADAIVRGLSSLAAYTVLDLPAYPSPGLEAALHLCDLVTLVVEPEPISVAAGIELLEALRSYGLDTVIIGAVVVNRADLSAPLASADIRSQLGCDIVGTVPPAADACALAVNLGAPLVLSQAEGMATTALNEIAGRLIVDNMVALHA